MEKPNFEYQTLDEALAAGGKNKVLVTNPEGIVPETKRVMQEVYERRAEFGENVIDFKYQSAGEFWTPLSHLQDAAIREAADRVMKEGLEDAASLGDVYVYSAVKEAQFRAYNTILAREFLKAKDLKKWCIELDKARNNRHAEEDFRKSHIVNYAKNFKERIENPPHCDFSGYSPDILGNKINYITTAVRKDIGLTKEETEKLKAKCDQIIRKSKGLVTRILSCFRGE